MKKFVLFVGAAFLMASCSTVTTKTARTETVPYAMYNANVADLEVGSRVTYTYTPEKSVRKVGLQNVKDAATQEVLAANGNADLLVEPQWVIVRKKGLSKKIKSVTVSGRPAKYVNIHSLPDNVWTDPTFRGNKNTKIKITK